MKKYLLILLLVVLMYPSVAFASWWNPFSWKIFASSRKKEVVPQVQIIDNKTMTSLTVKNKEIQKQVVNPEKKPKETTNDELYSVVLSTPPNRKSDDPLGEMKFKVKLKNLNVTPFITNLGTCSCNVSDLKGRKYQSGFTSESRLKKALLPGEEIVVDISAGLWPTLLKEGEAECRKDNMLDWSKNIVKCIYDKSGECVCEDLGPLKIDNCDFSISTDGKQASNGWGKYPITVKID